LGQQNKNKGILNINANVLLINKKVKSFSTLSRNNIGVNNSPFDYFSFNLNTEQRSEQNYTAKKIIPETQFSSLLGNERTNINNQFFGSYNTIFKINPKISIKTNLYYLNDRITTNQLLKNQFKINGENFTTSNNTFITKKPEQYRGDIKLKYNTSKTSLLEYNFRIRQENIKTPTKILQNQSDKFSSILETNDFYLKQKLLLTKKISTRKAVQFSLFHSMNNLSQNYSITPSLFNDNSENDMQENKSRKTYLEGKSTYLGSSNQNKYSFSVGINLKDTPFKSELSNSEETISKNNFSYKQRNIFSTGVYNINKGNWKISPSYSVRLLNQNLKQNIENQHYNKNNFIFEPALQIKFNVNSISSLSANLGYNQSANTEKSFYLNEVLISSRTTIKNIPSLELKKSKHYGLSYFKNDLYNQFELNAGVNYQKATGNFFTNQNISENTTQIKYFFSPQSNSSWNMNMRVSKYISPIESTIKLTSNYSISNFKNIVNNSELRQNKSQFIGNTIFWKTAFDIFANFENTFTWWHSKSQNENQSAFVNNSLKNSFKIILKPYKKWFFIISSDYYLPNTNKKEEQFFFLDTTFLYKSESKRWETGLVMRNLTNEENFEQVQTSDISTTVFRSNILPIYFLLNVTWNF
ncbi:MAG: hypothetical protein ACWIPJ_09520, partial [Polaribacter sp.]